MSWGDSMKNHRGTSNKSKIRHENHDIFKNGFSLKGV
jgi:hypothetical protein